MTARLALTLFGISLLLGSVQPVAAQSQIDAEAWMNSMVESLPGFFCQNDKYFMQCFEVNQTECEEVAKRQTRRCLGEIGPSIPPLLDMPEDGWKWGTDVGRCAGIGYDLELADLKSTAPRCNPG